MLWRLPSAPWALNAGACAPGFMRLKPVACAKLHRLKPAAAIDINAAARANPFNASKECTGRHVWVIDRLRSFPAPVAPVPRPELLGPAAMPADGASARQPGPPATHWAR